MVMEDAELFAAMDLSRPGLEGVRKAVEGKRFGEAYAAWGRYWAARPKPVWLFDPAAYRRAMKNDLPWLAPVIKWCCRWRDRGASRSSEMQETTEDNLHLVVDASHRMYTVSASRRILHCGLEMIVGIMRTRAGANHDPPRQQHDGLVVVRH